MHTPVFGSLGADGMPERDRTLRAFDAEAMTLRFQMRALRRSRN